jgi:tRNA threonylcarbamoyladenosine biosynthesis protein TsaB
MNILAFDTCFDACSVAVRCSDTGAITAERELMRRGHAEALMPMIERTMRAAGMSFDHLDRVAVTSGPGTFTGTRVGVTAALGLAFAHEIPVVTYSSLQCISRAAIDALGADAAGIDGVVLVRGAKRDSVYIEVTDVTGQEITAPALLGLAAANNLIDGRRYFVLGNGTGLLQAQTLKGHVTRWPGSIPSDVIEQPDARFLLQDAADRIPADPPAPLYLRPPDATPSSVPPLARLEIARPADA